MSETYLFASAEAPTPDAALQDLLRRAGARAAWLDEVHWLGRPLPAPLAGRPFYPWPDAPLLPLFCLQAALRNLYPVRDAVDPIQAGSGSVLDEARTVPKPPERAANLVALGQSGADGSIALLLGSPNAVGRWNLPPLARLSPLTIPAADPAAFLAGALQRAGDCLPEDVHLALASLSGFAGAALPDLPLLPPAEELFRPAHLAARLAQEGQDFALLAAWAAQAGLAFLVERI